MKTVGILLISTGKYHIFLQPLINDIEKHFFKGWNIEIYLFSDRENKIKHSDRINIVHIPTEHKPFPYPTLMRYSFFSNAVDKIKSDYLYYLDVDMSIVGNVREEILPDGINDGGLVVTHHPGFYNGGWGSMNVHKESKAWIPENQRKVYFAGGFNGGTTKAFLKMSKELSDNILDDESRGVMAEYHDESHMNAYMSTRNPKKLTPEYCMVEEQHLREKWEINHFVPKIIALKKDHKKIR